MKQSKFKRQRVLRQIRNNYPGLEPVLDIAKSKQEAKDRRDQKKYRKELKEYAKRCGSVERYFDPSLVHNRTSQPLDW